MKHFFYFIECKIEERFNRSSNTRIRTGKSRDHEIKKVKSLRFEMLKCLNGRAARKRSKQRNLRSQRSATPPVRDPNSKATRVSLPRMSRFSVFNDAVATECDPPVRDSNSKATGVVLPRGDTRCYGSPKTSLAWWAKARRGSAAYARSVFSPRCSVSSPNR